MEPQEVVFRPDDPEERSGVVERMGRLARERDGWVNLSPVLPEGVDQPRQGLLRFLGARGPEALLATWVPGERQGDGFGPATVGLQHAAGRRVVTRLAEAGHPVPDGWRITQDHPARGVVATVPDDADPDAVLGWLVAAATEVSSLPLTGRWRAAFYRRA